MLTVNDFSSNRKRSSIVYRNHNLTGTDEEVRVYCKGAPEIVLTRCTSLMTKSVKQMYGLENPTITSQVENMSKLSNNAWQEVR